MRVKNFTKAEIMSRYRLKHPDAAKEYHKRPEVRERHNFNSKIWTLGTIFYHHERKRRRDPETWCRRIVIHLRFRAKKNGLPFNLFTDDVFAVLPRDLCCPIFGTAFSFGEKLTMTSPSVDRLIPALGYVRGNIAVISARANTMKGTCTDPEDFRRLADYVERALQRQQEWGEQLAAMPPAIDAVIAHLRKQTTQSEGIPT